jgi:hypothetical protein
MDMKARNQMAREPAARDSLDDPMIGPRRVRWRHPTLWWRSHLAQDYNEQTARRMRACLARFDIRREPRWLDAATGDAAAAIGLAFKYRSLDCCAFEFHLAMTAVAVCAVRGSTCARIVMAKMLRWTGDGSDAEDRIVASWLMLAYTPKKSRNLDLAP